MFGSACTDRVTGWRRWTPCLTAAWLLVGCGGGGSGGGAPPPPPPIADTASTFWVAGTGSSWSYHLVDRRGASAGNAPTRLKTVQDRGEVSVAGRQVRHFEHSWSLFEAAPETEYRFFDGREIRGLLDAGALFGTALPAQDYAEVPAPLRDGETHTVVDRTEQIDVNFDGIADQLRIVVRTTLASQATLSVPAGDFRGVLRSRQQRRDPVHRSATLKPVLPAVARQAMNLLAWTAGGVRGTAASLSTHRAAPPLSAPEALPAPTGRRHPPAPRRTASRKTTPSPRTCRAR